jgi:hypothetical protein
VRAVHAEEPSRARYVWKFATSFAMVLLLVAGMFVQRHKETAKEMNALRAEHQKIETELKQVKAIADQAQPAVVLDNGQTRVIVDLNATTYY